MHRQAENSEYKSTVEFIFKMTKLDIFVLKICSILHVFVFAKVPTYSYFEAIEISSEGIFLPTNSLFGCRKPSFGQID